LAACDISSQLIKDCKLLSSSFIGYSSLNLRWCVFFAFFPSLIVYISSFSSLDSSSISSILSFFLSGCFSSVLSIFLSGCFSSVLSIFLSGCFYSVLSIFLSGCFSSASKPALSSCYSLFSVYNSRAEGIVFFLKIHLQFKLCSLISACGGVSSA